MLAGAMLNLGTTYYSGSMGLSADKEKGVTFVARCIRRIRQLQCMS